MLHKFTLNSPTLKTPALPCVLFCIVHYAVGEKAIVMYSSCKIIDAEGMCTRVSFMSLHVAIAAYSGLVKFSVQFFSYFRPSFVFEGFP